MNLGLQMLFGGLRQRNARDSLVLSPNMISEDAQIGTVIGLLQSMGGAPNLRLNPNSVSVDADIDDVIGVLQ